MPNLSPSPRFQVVRALTGLAVLLVALTVHVTNAYQPHHGHDRDSKAHKTPRPWDPTIRGSLVALDLDHTKFTALYYDMKTESVKLWSTPVCVIDRGARDQQPGGPGDTHARFSLCPPEVNPWPIRDRGPHSIPYDGCAWPDMFEGEKGHPICLRYRVGVRTFHQQGVGQVYTDLLRAYETQSIFPSEISQSNTSTWPDPRLLAIKLALPVSNHDLKQAGISDILSFYRLTHRPLHSRQFVTATQVFAIYLSLILRHTSDLISSSSASLSPISAHISAIIPIVPGTWPEYQPPGPCDISPLSSLLRAISAFDSRPPTVFRTLSRPLATVQGAQMDQLAACLHRSLRVLVVHRERRHGLYENNYKIHLNVVNVPLSDFLSAGDGLKFGMFWPITLMVDMIQNWIKEDVTHLVLTGNGWMQWNINVFSSSVPDAQVWPAVTATSQTGWMSTPYLSAAAAILDQQYSPCSRGLQDPMVVRCDRITREWSSRRLNKGVGDDMSGVVAATAPPATPLVLSIENNAACLAEGAQCARAMATEFYARHVVPGGWIYLGRQSNTSTVGVHERGWDFDGADGVGHCIPRADPWDLQQQKYISKHRMAMGVPPTWAQVVCLNPYLVAGSVARLRENQVRMAVVEWWAVDKRRFAPDLGKDEGGNGKGKCGR